VSRRRVDVAVPAIALRRAEAAASLGISIETFDQHVRPNIAAVQVGGVAVYPVAELQRFLKDGTGYDRLASELGTAVGEHPAPWPDRRYPDGQPSP
jgi:hypothetical protein